MNRVTIGAALAVSATMPAMLAAQTLPPERAFGARESVTSASLSPGGSRFAFLAPTAGQGNALYTAPVDGSEAPRRVMSASGDPERLTRCGWVSEQRLVCSIYAARRAIGVAFGTGRLVAGNIDGTDIKVVSRPDAREARYFSDYGGDVLDWLPGQDGAILMASWFVPEAKIGSLVEKRDEGLGVERVDTQTGQRKVVIRGQTNAAEYITDGNGVVRLLGVADKTSEVYLTGKYTYRYRAIGKGDWQTFGSYDSIAREGFNPYAVDSEKNVAYGFMKDGGRLALYTRSLDGTLADRKIYGRADVDVDGLIRLGRRGRVVGVTYATEKRVAVYFDPALETLRDKLAKALPNADIVNFEGASTNEQKLLLWAGSDVDPGRYYLFDRTTKQLRPLILSRPELAGVTLARVKPIQVRASDGAMIPAYLTLPPGSDGKGLPAIVMPHGGPSARDEWGFDWLAQYFAHQGYAVLQPNFRGSTGYGDEWYQHNGFRSWRVAIGDVVDSGKWLVAQGIADPAKLGIFGWSYGGYAALQSGVVAPELFKGIVAVAPVTDLNDLREQYRDTVSQRTAADIVGSGPHIREGSPAQNAKAIKAPVLMFHGVADQNVRIHASQLMAGALRGAGKTVDYVEIPKLDHYLDDADVRADLLKRSDAFLQAAFAR